MPVLLPNRPDSARELVAWLDGLVLSGGADIDPLIYDQSPHAKTYAIDPERDRFEMELVQSAAESGLPCLAICRGIQVMNVALGGSLVQHIPDHTNGQVVHEPEAPAAPPPLHEVRVQAGSRLAAVLGSETARVNSFHHQAVNRPGKGVHVVARAPDGVIEGIELPDHPFALGVQWHPERLFRQDAVHFALFCHLALSCCGDPARP